jgi:hypothetical protein
VLDACLRASPVPMAIAAYESARVSRANEIVIGARRLGRLAMWRSGVACGLRDLLLRATPRSVVRRQMRKLLVFPQQTSA